jgi:large-conductance mechanosensitive channel
MFGSGQERSFTEMKKNSPVLRVWEMIQAVISFLLVVTSLLLMILIIALW